MYEMNETLPHLLQMLLSEAVAEVLYRVVFVSDKPNGACCPDVRSCWKQPIPVQQV